MLGDVLVDRLAYTMNSKGGCVVMGRGSEWLNPGKPLKWLYVLLELRYPNLKVGENESHFFSPISFAMLLTHMIIRR